MSLFDRIASAFRCVRHAGGGDDGLAADGSSAPLVRQADLRLEGRRLGSALAGVTAAICLLLAVGVGPAVADSCPNASLRYGYGASLPDCRAYEQASPVDKGGIDVTGSLTADVAAQDGNGITFFTTVGLPTDGGAPNFPVYEAQRTAAGWETHGLYPAGAMFSTPILGVTPDLSETFEGAASGFLSPAGTFEVRDNSDGALTPIATVTKGATNFFLDEVSASANDVLFEQKNVQLLANAAANQDNVYLWDRPTNTLHLVGVLPDGSTPAAGSFAGGVFGVTGGAAARLLTQHTLSADGTRAFFTAGGQQYVRIDPAGADATTVEASASQRSVPDPNGSEPANWWASPPDGSEVFFTSCEKLTDDSTAVSTGDGTCSTTSQGQDLYAYDVTSGQLTDLTVDNNPSDARGAAVNGVLGISDDGSYVYFAADGVLAPGAAPDGDCEQNQDCNIYVWHDGVTRFIATLSGGEMALNFTQQAQPVRVGKTSRVSPDGRTLLFEANNQLTAYDNQGAAEFYLWRDGDTAPSCISCDPSGAAPLGDASLYNLGPFPNSPNSTTVGAVLTRNLSSDGQRVIFQTPDPLLPADTNGDQGCSLTPYNGKSVLSCQDVYEWEADGQGSCHSTSQNGGCLFLISTGKSPDPSFIADVSASGNDVFFFTRQPLVGQDQDQLVDVYDARVDGGLATQDPAPGLSCSGDACRGPASGPSAAPAAATVTFFGPGNPQASTTSATAKARVLTKAVRGTSFTVRVRVPAPGRISITGAGIDPGSVRAARAGTYRLRVALTAAAKRRLARRHKLELRLRTAYTPRTGKASAATVALAVKPALSHHASSRASRRRANTHNHGGAK